MSVEAPVHGQLDLIRPEVEFYAHQVEGVRRLARMRNFILGDQMGLGKGHPLSTPVLTPSGWRPIGGLQPGDRVIGSGGDAVNVTGVFPKPVQAIYEVTFSDGASVRCDSDHLWAVQTANDRFAGSSEWRVVSTQQILDEESIEFFSTNAQRSYSWTPRVKQPNGNRTMSVPMVKPVAFDYQAPWLTPVPPYILGVILGDGSINKNGNVTISKGDDTAAVRSLVERDAETRDLADPRSFAMSVPELVDLGLADSRSHEKFVPDAYLTADPKDRLALLQGLMDTDGYAHPDGGSEFSSTSLALAEAVVDLAQSLGGVARMNRQGRHTTYPLNGEMKVGRRSWRVNVRLPAGVNPFLLQRKADLYRLPTKYEPSRWIESIERVEDDASICISVDAEDSLYVTKDYIVTHNTIQALSVAAIDFQLGHAARCLVVCPATLKTNWESEIADHTLMTSTVLHGSPTRRSEQIEEFKERDDHFLILNYELVDKHLKELNALKFDILICDEAHAIKSFRGFRSSQGARRSKAVHRLDAKRVFLLTGSPMLNRPDELWSLLHRIAPGEFPSYYGFVSRFCVFGGFKDKQIVGVKNEDELNGVLQTYMVRRLKKDSGVVLPPKQYIPVIVDLSDKQRRLYDEVKDELQLTIPGDPSPADIENAMTRMLRLKQICGTTATIEGYPDSSHKLDRSTEIIEEITSSGERVVVFTQFRGVLASQKARLEKLGIATFELHGDVPGDTRVEVVKEWGRTPAAALLVMIQVGGVGLNMTQASKCIFLDKDWVPMNNEQAEDRLHRIGAKAQDIQIFQMICKGTIEDHVEKLLRRKKKMFDAIVNTSDFKRKLIDSLMEEA